MRVGYLARSLALKKVHQTVELEDTMQERTMPKGTSKLTPKWLPKFFAKVFRQSVSKGTTPKCLALKASALLAEMKAIFPDRDLRILEHGVEKTQGWLSGTEGLHIVAEKAMAELEWKNAALSEDINAIYQSVSRARFEWCEDDKQIFTAVLFLIHGMDDSNQHKFYPIKQELDMVPFLHGECKSLCEPRRLLQKTMRFICPDSLEQGSSHLVLSIMCLGLLKLENFCIIWGVVLKVKRTPKLKSVYM